jgi:hypothetical protein
VLVVVLLVAAALAVGVFIELHLDRQSSEDNASPTSTQTPASPTPIPTEAVTPAPSSVAIPNHNVAVTYSEVNRQTNEAAGTTTVVLSVEAQYAGEAVTLSFDRFELSILTSRGGLEPYPIYLQSGLALPAETGSVTVSQSHPLARFELSFDFSTLQQSSQDGILPFYGYELRYV